MAPRARHGEWHCRQHGHHAAGSAFLGAFLTFLTLSWRCAILAAFRTRQLHHSHRRVLPAIASTTPSLNMVHNYGAGPGLNFVGITRIRFDGRR